MCRWSIRALDVLIAMVIVAVSGGISSCTEMNAVEAVASPKVAEVPPIQPSTERRMTESEAHAFIARLESAPLWQLRHRDEAAAVASAIKIKSTGPSRYEERDVTETGLANGHAEVEIDLGSTWSPAHIASWAASTSVIIGVARSVYTEAQGSYRKLNYGLKSFSDSCPNGPVGIVQTCAIGTSYTDLDCTPTSNGIHVSTSHAVQWLFGWQSLPPLSDDLTCRDARPPSLKNVTISGGTAVYVGEGLALSASAVDDFDQDGSYLCSTFTWSSSNDSVATVSSSGGVTGVSSGQATISASCLGVSGSAVVTASARCGESGEGQLDRIGGLSIRTMRLRTRAGVSAYCGDLTGYPGGGAGNPPGDPGEHCHYTRDYVIYTDGSWSWLTDWMLHCGVGGEEARIAAVGSGGHTNSASLLPVARSLAPIRVRLLGTGKLSSGRAVELHTYPSFDADVEVSVDMNRATAADIEVALADAERLADSKGKQHVASILGTPSEKDVATSARGSRGATYLRSLSTAAKADSRLGNVKVLNLTVERAAATGTGRAQDR